MAVVAAGLEMVTAPTQYRADHLLAECPEQNRIVPSEICRRTVRSEVLSPFFALCLRECLFACHPCPALSTAPVLQLWPSQRLWDRVLERLLPIEGACDFTNFSISICSS
mmetsp:Transcript_14761/g.25214  ORF Transcript_14761/g.25214 Transcript_14761/m.25214 type:complete len:110 (-) Transcript_14761:119-448(-)